MEILKRVFYYIFTSVGVMLWILALCVSLPEDNLWAFLINCAFALVGSLFLWLAIVIDRHCKVSILKDLLKDDDTEITVNVNYPKIPTFECEKYVYDDGVVVTISDPPTEMDKVYLFALSLRDGKEQADNE